MIDEELTFVDTNVLVCAHDSSEKEKQPVAKKLLGRLWERHLGALSTQVLQEFYVVATRKFSPPLARSTARQIIGLYAAWPLVKIDLALILTASESEERDQLSFWDALIVEAARRAGATRIVSEDFQHERTLNGVRIINPFA